jgi:hypothetical protein
VRWKTVRVFLGVGYGALLLVTAVFSWDLLVFPLLLLAAPPHFVILTFLTGWPSRWLFPTWVLVLLLVAQVITARWIARNKRIADKQELTSRVRVALWATMALVAAQCVMELLT